MTPAALPAHLAERVRPAASDKVAAAGHDGDFVLYWMHHAVRALENPALDAATCAAHELGLPLLVYQGLGGAHPYDSDRHHTFILEGAREVADALEKCGVRYVFHLPQPGTTASPLGALCTRAALVLTEDFPVPPFAGWTRRLAARINAPVWRVDTACVFPMRLTEGAFARAFEFRRAHGREQLRRARQPWPPCGVRAHAFEGDVGFAPLDLTDPDVAGICAGLAIDHSVGPAPDTHGGSAAGLERWSAFVDHGLASYGRLRNDAAVAPPRGVSRISPYLHHGHISPLRIARDAAAQDSDGAAKFLDELLVWRELAHNFCFHHEHLPGGLASLDRLPAWAQETLMEHSGDQRAADYTWETLARGRTGDALWDAAQQSLRVHGELHNNVRMTWGKAFLDWTPSPGRALALMLDLNHRYALDGSDPNSYGGLLYCLGLFDRPFLPARPVAGTVRERSTEGHARRLDLASYRQRIRRRGDPTVAVVGGGVSGLAAARALVDNGVSVRVFDRGRGPGGRAAHRRRGDLAFDHGAQYFTARDPRFVRHVEAWVQRRIVARWDAHIVALGADGGDTTVSSLARYVGTPGMNQVAGHLAQGLALESGCVVQGARREGKTWFLDLGDGATAGPFDAVILAMPPEQSARLLAPELGDDAGARTRSLPCWCAMVAFDDALPLAFDGAFVNGETLDWVARDSSKPGRPPGERWTLHATPGWSESRLHASREDVAAALLADFFDVLQVPSREPTHLAAHRWSLARPASDLQVQCLWRDEHALALCGDWCLGGRVEGAYLSGEAAAGRVLGALRSKG